MDDKRKPVNGPFTQIPNVFFDTCDLPETAQILFLRLVRKFGYTGGRFTGSIRELGKIVRYSKSTTDRMVKVLRDANLIMIEYDTEGTMIITLNTSDLWALNKYHYEVHASQIWDSKLPCVPEMGQPCPENGTLRTSQKWDKSVPELGQDQAQSEAPKEREEMKERMEEEHSPTPSLTHSSLHEDIVNFIRERREINFSDLEAFVHPCMNVRGDHRMPLRNNFNLLAWIGLSDEFYELIIELEASYHVKAALGTIEDYPKLSSRPNLPVAEHGVAYKYTKPHWMPMVLIIEEEG